MIQAKPGKLMADRSLANHLQEALALLSIFLYPSKTHAEKVYQFLSTDNNFAEKSLYLNLGYWHNASTYDQACQALAQLLGERAQLQRTDIVLDVGFGFADQDLFWAQNFCLQKIIGLNITPLQIEVGKRRVEEAGLSDRIDLRFGSATDIPLEKESVDKVVCLESAFHFNTRETFFQEAWRVLRPGGWLAVADMIPLAKQADFRTSITEAVGQLLWQIPDANMYTAEVLEEKLRSCGFENRKLESIRDNVFIPFGKFARRRIQDPEVKKRMNPMVRWLWSVDHDKEITDDRRMDYLIITAQKL